MSLEEEESDYPPPNSSHPIVNLYADGIAVYRPSFANAASRVRGAYSDAADAAYIQYNWTNSYGDHGDVGAAFHHLWLENLDIQGTTDFTPTRVHSVPVATPRRPQSSEAIFSALGFHQDEATVEVDIHNQAIRLFAALEVSNDVDNQILINTNSPW